MASRTSRYDDATGKMRQQHRAPNNHIGRRIVQRQSGQSGPVTRFVPGTPEYEELIATREKPRD